MADISREMLEHYATGYEAGRLTQGSGRIELARTQELVRRHLPAPPALVCDIGGGPGVYALWLARLGYTVHLVDPVPIHIAQAHEASAAQPDAPLASCTVDDARRIALPDGSVDAALLFGPLYHLTERTDRLAALREARRIVRRGGVVLAVGISRFVSTLDGMLHGYLDDPVFVGIAAADRASGQHRNPTNHPDYFTTTYFHHPAELAEEVTEAGLIHTRTVGIEGPAWLIAGVRDTWNDPERRARYLDALRAIEEEPSLLGASQHLMVIARRT